MFYRLDLQLTSEHPRTTLSRKFVYKAGWCNNRGRIRIRPGKEAMATDITQVSANLLSFYDFRDKVVVSVGAGGGQLIEYARSA